MLRRGEIDRLVVSLVADELGRARKRAVDLGVWAGWGPETKIDEDGIGVDSLGRLDLAARVNEFFHLHESGVEDYLLVRRTLGDWSEIVEAGLERAAERLTFRSSGTTGAPKPTTHLVARLAAEVDAVWARIGPRARIIAWTPPHHIYGFLFSALAPARFELELVDARVKPPSLRGARAGDLVVAAPFHWERLLRDAPTPPENLVGLTAAAPAPAALWERASASGLRLIELYGSSETAGVGARESGTAPFELLPGWRRSANAALLRDGGEEVAPPDRLDWNDAARFRPAGRRDGVVQVAGVNVDPAVVREVLLAHGAVADAAVRLDEAGGADARLKAFIVPKDAQLEPAALAAIREALTRHCADSLDAPARPARFDIGAALPRSALGKLTDWAS